MQEWENGGRNAELGNPAFPLTQAVMDQHRKEIRTEIVIHATPERVWSILMDFAAYPKWNPFIKSITGDLVEGKKITARLEPPGGSGMTFKPTIKVINANKEFRWLGHLFFPGLFDGEHIFELYENTDRTTTFIQREQFSGILVPLFTKMLDTTTLQAFDLMNRKLKELAEGKLVDSKRTKSDRGNAAMIVVTLLFLMAISFTTIGQSRFSKTEVSVNAFRNPSVGLEFRRYHVSVHAGYYPTNFESGVTTSFLRTGVTYWFLPVGRKENPSSFYSSVSFARGFDREYTDKSAVMTEAGFRWMVWKGLNFRFGVVVLKAAGESLKINPTPGFSYSFFFR